MKRTRKIKKLMMAYAEGKQIQFYNSISKTWKDLTSPKWNYPDEYYRIKPKSRIMTPCEIIDWWEKDGKVIYERNYCTVVSISQNIFEGDDKYCIGIIDYDNQGFPRINQLTRLGFLGSCTKTDGTKFEVEEIKLKH